MSTILCGHVSCLLTLLFHKDACTIFQIGTSRSRLQYLHFDQSSCTSDEDYLRSPIVYSALDVSKSFASDLIIQDAPGTLFKGLDSFDGFNREYGWTLQTTGSVVQSFIMATSTNNGRPNAAVAVSILDKSFVLFHMTYFLCRREPLV